MSPGSKSVAVARNAMATRFEILLCGEDPVSLRAAGEEALDEIVQIEAQLSLHRATSEVSHLNARAASGPVRVTPSLFALLRQARGLWEDSEGAFDITIAPLARAWGFTQRTGRVPSEQELGAARACVGMDKLSFNDEECSIQFSTPGLQLDFGAIGKGYAIERAAALLRDLDITRALLHGGTSTVHAIGSPPGADAWIIAIDSAPGPDSPPLAKVPLVDESLSVSAVWGKSFAAEDETFGHVLDPRSGRPVQNALLAAVVTPSATESDALSTALLARASSGPAWLEKLRPASRSLLLSGAGALRTAAARGIDLLPLPEFAN